MYKNSIYNKNICIPENFTEYHINKVYDGYTVIKVGSIAINNSVHLCSTLDGYYKTLDDAVDYHLYSKPYYCSYGSESFYSK